MAVLTSVTVRKLRKRFSNHVSPKKSKSSMSVKIIPCGIIRTPTANLYNEVSLQTLEERRDRSSSVQLSTQ